VLNQTLVEFSRSVPGCGFYWTLTNSAGAANSENDPFIQVFDHVNHVLVFGSFEEADASLVGARVYTLCSVSSWNGVSACVDINFNINVVEA
jgi:fructose-specific component phosphotransferase system IIB-like protein